jgi:hypothetical protein
MPNIVPAIPLGSTWVMTDIDRIVAAQAVHLAQKSALIVECRRGTVSDYVPVEEYLLILR